MTKVSIFATPSYVQQTCHCSKHKRGYFTCALMMYVQIKQAELLGKKIKLPLNITKDMLTKDILKKRLGNLLVKMFSVLVTCQKI